ncbi:MAG: agmatinase family protein, partial [Bacteroidetes bacterium]|nr:agmatinase family protein [Bacteroidota bacterium]
MPYTTEEAEIVLLSVPWDVTTSYRPGTHKGPKAMIAASVQIDLYDPLVPQAWEIPIGTLPPLADIDKKNRSVRKFAQKVISALEQGQAPDYRSLALVNDACAALHQTVRQTCQAQINQGKLVGIVGGEHSVPLGLMQALHDQFKSFGILHIDAHADLRCAYEGFTFSHASIMHHAARLPGISLTQVGIRDYCQDEADLIAASEHIRCFSDQELRRRLFQGDTWSSLCRDIIESLPQNVYISFDIDGLSPDCCPHTGTPVPGGLTFREADYLLHSLAASKKRIIGFDLCEV